MTTSNVKQSSTTNRPAYFARFGLKREPFSESVEDDFFFTEVEGGERVSLTRLQRLNLLLHLAPYSDVLLVTGEAGIGKTTMLRQFLANVESSWRVCALNAGPTINNEVVIQSLMREFAKEDNLTSDVSNQIDSLCKHIQELRNSAQSPILIIDDAHQLSQEVLTLLLRLVQTNRDGGKLLSVIMFGEPSIENILAVSEIKPLRNLISHSFELTPFNEDDTSNYIKHRLNVAGLTGENPFTPAVVKVIHSTSHGVPAKINELSQVVLNNSAAVEPLPISFTMPAKSEVFKRYGLVGGITILVIVVLLFQDNINKIFRADKSADSAAMVAMHEQSEKNQLPNTVSQSVSRDKTTQTEIKSTSNIEHPASEEIVDKDPAKGVIARVSALDSGATQVDNSKAAMHESSAGQIPENPEKTDQSPEDGNENIPDESDDRKITTVQVEVTGSEKKVTTITSDSTTETISAPQPKPKPLSQDTPTENKSTTQSAAKTATAKPAGDRRREDWLLEQNPQHYTLQLLAIQEEAIIKRFIKDNHLQDQATYFNTYNNGKEWFAVVYGSYTTRTEADLAAKQLQNRIARLKPWVRSLKSVQESIASFQKHQKRP